MTALPSHIAAPQYGGMEHVRTARTLRAEFGDGYVQEARDGLNSVSSAQTLTWSNLSKAHKADLDNFFTGLAGAAPFTYQPPDESQTRQWKCKTWRYNLSSPGHYTFTAELEEAFDL